jgi:hypothetical protein
MLSCLSTNFDSDVASTKKDEVLVKSIIYKRITLL